MATLTNVRPGTTEREWICTLMFAFVMSVLIGALVQLSITHTEPYDLGRLAVGSRLNVKAEMVKLKRLAPMQFNEGASSGEAVFVLCAQGDECFTVVAQKRDARWSVTDLVQGVSWTLRYRVDFP